MDSTTDQAAGKRNKWMTHVKKTMRKNKGKSLAAVLKIAKKSYKGGSALSPADYKGGRRTARKTAGRRKH